MTASIFDLFSIGVGPSSSHTVGPMRAAATFARHLDTAHGLTGVARVDIHLYGSLAATGHGHGTLTACAIGLEANHPEDVTPKQLESTVQRITSTGELILAGKKPIPFAFKDIVLHPLTVLPRHTNGMRFAALEEGFDRPLFEQTYYSIGGGFIICDGEDDGSISTSPTVPYPFASGAELLKVCDALGVSISDVMLDNELAQHDMATVTARILEIYQVMQDCVRHSVRREGLLPGALKVRRRAKIWRYSPSSRKRRGDSHGTPPRSYRDPVGGLVQMSCIERNAIGANKAINAARMALRGDGEHRVSLDQVMETMRQTGHDMSYKYKETSLAGLATNVPIC